MNQNVSEQWPDSVFWERPRDGGKEVSVRQVQIPRGRSDVGMAQQALDDVDVHAPAHEARVIGVTPPMSKVPTGHTC